MNVTKIKGLEFYCAPSRAHIKKHPKGVLFYVVW